MPLLLFLFLLLPSIYGYFFYTGKIAFFLRTFFLLCNMLLFYGYVSLSKAEILSLLYLYFLQAQHACCCPPIGIQNLQTYC